MVSAASSSPAQRSAVARSVRVSRASVGVVFDGGGIGDHRLEVAATVVERAGESDLRLLVDRAACPGSRGSAAWPRHDARATAGCALPPACLEIGRVGGECAVDLERRQQLIACGERFGQSVQGFGFLRGHLLRHFAEKRDGFVVAPTPGELPGQRQQDVVAALRRRSDRLLVESRGGRVPVRPGVDACRLDQQVGLAGLLGEQDLVHGDRLGITLLVDQHAGLIEVGCRRRKCSGSVRRAGTVA